MCLGRGWTHFLIRFNDEWKMVISSICTVTSGPSNRSDHFLQLYKSIPIVRQTCVIIMPFIACSASFNHTHNRCYILASSRAAYIERGGYFIILLFRSSLSRDIPLSTHIPCLRAKFGKNVQIINIAKYFAKIQFIGYETFF